METLAPTFPPEPLEEISPLDLVLARSHMRAFMRVVAPGYVDMWGCGLTCEYLTRVARRVRGLTGEGTLDALFLFGPPQHWKSYLMGQYFPAFLAAQRPDVRLLNVCHNRDLSNRAIRDFSTVLDLDAYKHVSRVRYGRVTAEDGSAVREEAAAKRVRFLACDSDGAVRPTGGFYLSSSIEGGATGWGANYVGLDDLVPDPEAAESPSQRRKLEQNVRSVAFTRMQADSALVCSMTPWVKGDIGETMEQWCRDAGLQTEALSLPAVAEPGIDLHPADPRTPGSGEVLDPYRHNAAFYRQRRILMGPYIWGTMWQTQRSAGTSDLVVPSAWQTFDPTALKVRTVDLIDIVLGVDPNGKEGGPCDAHVSLWAVVRRGRRLETWKLGEWHGAWAYDVLKLTVGELRSKWPIGHLVIECNNYGTSLVSELQRRQPVLGVDGRALRPMKATPHVEAVNPRTGKLARAKAVRPIIEAGLARLPGMSLGDVTTTWAAAHREGWETWPGKQKSDLDRIDCDAMCIDYIQARWRIVEAYCEEQGIKPR